MLKQTQVKTKQRAKRKPQPLKYKRNLFGLTVAYTVSAMLGAVGVAGWLQSGHGVGPLAFAGLAAGAAFIVPICAGQVSRGGTGWLAIVPALVFAGWSAFSIENANRVIVEAPHKAAHVAEQAGATAAAATAEARVVTLQAKRDALQPEVVECHPCRQTKADAAARDAAKAADLDRQVVAAKADVPLAEARVKPYVPATDWRLVLLFGAIVDLALAVLVWQLERGAEQNRRNAERAAEKASKPKAEQKPAKAKRKVNDGLAHLLTAEERRVLNRPQLIVDNG